MTDTITLRFCDNSDKELMQYRMLWDEIFHDSQGFTDYYFDVVCKRNRILGAYDGKALIGMVHANPYTVYDRDTKQTHDACYLVGVSVKETYRNRGIMRRMMEHMMKTLADEECLFVFLMPKKREYYLSLGFEPVYDTVEYAFSVNGDESSQNQQPKDREDPDFRILRLSQIERSQWQLLSDVLNGWFAVRYRYFSKRTPEYLERLLAEYVCQGGDVALVFDGEAFYGLFSYAVYGDVLYAERCEVLFEQAFDKLVPAVKRQAMRCGCKSCRVTVPKELFDGAKCKKTANGDGETVSDGYGIMACALIPERFAVENMKNQSFFDEIV